MAAETTKEAEMRREPHPRFLGLGLRFGLSIRKIFRQLYGSRRLWGTGKSAAPHASRAAETGGTVDYLAKIWG